MHDETRLDFAIDLARRAGALALESFRRLDTLTIESKGHHDLVSEADRDVEIFIREAIAEAWPGDGIVGEEHPPLPGTSGCVWIIDPIDGTANFLRGIPAWCVVIVCVRDGMPFIAATFDPSAGEMFSARRGGGAFLNGRPIRAAGARSLTEGSVGVGFNNRTDHRNVVRLVSELFERGGIFYRNQSGALMLAYVAAGRLIGYCEEHMNAWDCLAGMLMIEEAGGCSAAPDPQTVVMEGTRVVVAAAGVFDEVDAIARTAFGEATPPGSGDRPGRS